MDPSTALVNPFPNGMRNAFQAYIQDPSYTNRNVLNIRGSGIARRP